MPFVRPSAAWKYVIKPKLHRLKEKTTKGIHKTQHNVSSGNVVPVPTETTHRKSKMPKIIPRSKSKHKVKEPKIVPVPRS